MATRPLQGNCIIEMQKSLKERLQDASCTARPKRGKSIFKVPERLRGVSPEDYEPRHVSIGPFHRGKDSLRSMEAQKLHYLNLFLKRKESLNLDHCINSMKELEEEARNCYSENFEMSSGQFVEMMLLDGYFIVEHVLSDDYSKHYGYYDMLLLENQLPFFIIRRLLDLVGFNQIRFVSSLIDSLSVRFVSGNRQPPENFDHHHILHLYVKSFEDPQESDEEADEESDESIHGASCCKAFSCFDRIFSRPIPAFLASWKAPSATELHECGAKFRRTREGTFLDVKISDGMIQMRTIQIDEETVPLVRNFVALEQCNEEYGFHFTSYAFFIIHLVRSPMDVALLGRKGVLIHCLGNDKEACHVVNKLGKNVVVGEHYLDGVTVVMNNYCHSRRNRWRTTLSRKYFGNPWSFLSLLAATLLLVLTILQIVFTIIQYFHPKA